MKEKFDGLVDQLFVGNVFLPEAIEILERSMIHRAMQEAGGNQSAASKQLGIHRNTLQRKLTEYGFTDGRSRSRRKPPARSAGVRKRKKSAA
jgi:Fis family transcriptional regulator